MLTINFYDDGAATEPEAVCAAIETLTSNKNEYLWLWICGKDKGGDLKLLTKTLLEKLLTGKIFKLNLCSQIGLRVYEQLLANLAIHKFTKQNTKQNSESFNWSNKNLDQKLQLIEKLKFTIIYENSFKKTLTNLQTLELIKKDFNFWRDWWQNFLLINNKKQFSQEPQNPVLNIALSPGGSSKDEFENYLERSQFWSQIVQSLN